MATGQQGSSKTEEIPSGKNLYEVHFDHLEGFEETHLLQYKLEKLRSYHIQRYEINFPPLLREKKMGVGGKWGSATAFHAIKM